MGWLSDFLGDNALNLIGTGYSIYQDQRNYKYQKELQQELWRRDDNAIQRKMADYAAAGINPLMVASTSGASNTSAGEAGSQNIISPQRTPAEMKIDRERAKQEENKTDYEKKMYNFNLDMAKLQQNILTIQRDNILTDMFNSLGIPYYAKTWDAGDTTEWYFQAKPGLTINPADMPKQRLFNNQLQISDMQRAIAGTDYSRALNDLILSNKNIKWDTANRILDFTLGVTGAYGDIMSPFKFGYNQSTVNGNYTSQSTSRSTNYNYNTRY